jgi:hypothetical protein
MSWRNGICGGLGVVFLFAASAVQGEEPLGAGPHLGTGPYLHRERAVATGQGERLQLRTRSEDGEGFELQQRWIASDGETVRREHILRFSQSDPETYERYHYLTLPHDRYLEQTHRLNSETGTLERTFHGPNGQTWGSASGESPAVASGPARTAVAERAPPSREGMNASAPGLQRTDSAWGRFFRELNPFAGSGASSVQPPVRNGRPGGFTVGTGASANRMERPAPPRVTPAASAWSSQAAGPRERPAHAAARPSAPSAARERSLPPSAAAARNR